VRRGLTALLLVSGALAALLDPSAPVVALVAVSVVALTYGYSRRSEAAVLASGWLLYVPLSLVLLPYLGGIWSFLAVAIYVSAVIERLSFECELSEVLESPTGLDAEARSLAGRLSERELLRVLELIALSAGVGAVSASLVGANTNVSVLTTVTLMLFLATAAYAYALSRKT